MVSPSHPSLDEGNPSSRNALSSPNTSANPWKKIPEDATNAIHHLIDLSSWPALEHSSRKPPEPHSPKSPSTTTATMSPPGETLPESATSSSTTTAASDSEQQTAAFDSDQQITRAAPPPLPPPSHPRPYRPPSQNRNQNHRFASNNATGSGFEGNNSRRHHSRPGHWNSHRRGYTPRNFNNDLHSPFHPQLFRPQLPAQPMLPSFSPYGYPNSAPAGGPMYYSPPQASFPGYMFPGYYGEVYIEDASRPWYNGPAPYNTPNTDAMRNPSMQSQPIQVDSAPGDREAEKCCSLRRQIEYYFSNDNLVKDNYLRDHMDSYGWVPVHLISGFNRVKQQTSDINLILRALQPSDVVEVQGHKMRRRGDWKAWLKPPTSSSPAGAVQNNLVSSLGNLSLNEAPGMETTAESQPVDTVSTCLSVNAHDEYSKEHPSGRR